MTTANIYDMTDTWNAAGTTFTAVKMNITDTASAAGSLLFDFQVGGVTAVKSTKTGLLTAVAGFSSSGNFTGSSNFVLQSNTGAVVWGSANDVWLKRAGLAGLLKITPADATTPSGAIQFMTKAGAFVAADVPLGGCLDGYDSTNGTRKRYMNEGGTLYAVAYA